MNVEMVLVFRTPKRSQVDQFKKMMEAMLSASGSSLEVTRFGPRRKKGL